MRNLQFTPEETAILYHISSSLLEAADLHMCSSLADFIGQELKLAGCSIWHLPEDAPGPERLGFYQREGEVILDYLPNLDYQVASRVAESGEMLVENDISKQAGFRAGLMCPAVMALPLISDRKSYGAVCMWVDTRAGEEMVSLIMAREIARLLSFYICRSAQGYIGSSQKNNERPEPVNNFETEVLREQPVVPGLTFGARSLGICDRGADFYDFTLTGGNNLAILLGDLIGNNSSIQPWKHAAMLALRMTARRDVPPGAACLELNNLLFDDLHQSGILFGCGYAYYKPLTKDFTYTNAGYSAPVIIRGGSGQVLPGGKSNPFIGHLKTSAYAEQSVRLNSGDIVVFSSNGLAELFGRDGSLYPRERIVETIMKYHYYNAPSLMDCLILDLHRFLGGRRPLGNVILAVLKVE